MAQWRWVVRLLCVCCCAGLLAGCQEAAVTPKLGISFGVGEAARWPYEMTTMRERAKALGLAVETRFNKVGQASTSQLEDCAALLDAGATVLILVPRDADTARQVVEQAHARGAKVILYARPVHGMQFDFFVGYDTYEIGRTMGQTLAERVSQGKVMILKGDPDDINSASLYDGAMRALQPYIDAGDIQVVADAYVSNWSAELARQTVQSALREHDGAINGVLAFNDRLAGAAAQAVGEGRRQRDVAIVGMDAELPALRRLVIGTQAATIYMDLKAMANVAVDVAGQLARGQPVLTNAKAAEHSNVDAYLVNGTLVTRENLRRVLVTPGVYPAADVYGSTAP